MKKILIQLFILLVFSGSAVAGVFGNEFWMSGTGQHSLNDADDKTAINFTARHTGHIWKVYVRMDEVGVSPEYRYGFKTKKDGTWLAWQNKTITASEYTTITLNSNLSVTSGDVLCFSIEPVGTPDAANYTKTRSPEPRNAFTPFAGTSDADFGVWWYDTNWVKQTDNTPCFVTEYNDTHIEGQPYYTTSSENIYNQTVCGERFIQNGTRNIQNVSVYIRRSDIIPIGSVYAQLRNSTTNAVVTSAILTDNTASNVAFVKYTANFPTPLDITNRYSYDLVLIAEQANATGYYRARRIGAYTAYQSLTYNGTDSIYIESTDNGSTWSESESNDIYFTIGDTEYYYPPVITSYAPIGSIYPEVADTQLFNVSVNQSTQCRWYVNGSLVETDSVNTEHAYTNTSLNGGGCNITAVANNTNGSDSQTWIFEVGADSVSYIILQDTPTNQSMIKEINVTRIGSNVTDWGIYQNHTFNGWQYFFRFTNGTEIMNLTASGNNDTLWFNHTSLLPTGVYFINASNAAPVITNLTNSTPKTTSVTITWDTDISSNNRVYYGTNETEINAWTNGTWSSWHNSTTSISIGLSGLSTNTTYYYKPESRDVAINQSVAAENFTTAETTGIETFVNPSFISTGAAAILFVAAAGRFAISAWRNRRRKRRN